ncbi:MAG TPA: PxKF domain-containing protein [Gaiellales bacterium]|nr:PxKF domain-containing protein [Gaiellales bacterium]
MTAGRKQRGLLGTLARLLVPVGVVASLTTGAAQGAQPATELISVTPQGASADEVGAFGRPQWSANGRVVFTSTSANLVPGDTNGRRDVFVRDLATGTTTLVSTGLNGLPANNDSDDASISADGRYVAFGSLASNLVAGDSNGFSDVFVRDLETGTTTRLSMPPGGGQANGHSALGSPAMISANGRFVAFSSTAQNLAPSKPDFTREVYVADRDAGTVVRASVPQGGGWENGASDAASVSNDGVVVFQSAASNLVANDGNGARDVFVRDTAAGTTLLVSHAPTGETANGASTAGLPGITPDGTHVVFASSASNLVPDDTNLAGDVFLYDRASDAFTLVSTGDGGAPAKGTSTDPSVSDDGRWVAFASFAANIVPGDGDGTTDIFVRDLSAGVTQRASVTDAGDDPNGISQLPTLSPDGAEVAFGSKASNLVPADGAAWDLFAHRVESDGEPPSITCPDADGAWHAGNATITCTASDAASGLADPADASFTLATSVDAGTETADAATDTRSVCDVAGNCAVAGPVRPFRIDRRAPAISVSTPADGAVVTRGAVVNPVYACIDGGSGTATCAGPAGPLDTATPGHHQFTITATDAAGNSSSLTSGYWVDGGYTWGGFFTRPLTHAHAGRVIPVAFSLGGNFGDHVVAPGYPVSAPVTCGSADVPAGGDPVRLVGGGVHYFRWWGRYVLLWQTDRAWAGTCRAFILKLDDGSTHAFVVRFDRSCRGSVWAWPPTSQPSKIASMGRISTTS